MDESSRDVVILGAGFSRQVHETFPLVSTLAERVLPYLEQHAAPSTQALLDELRRAIDASNRSRGGSDTPATVGPDFESWLSRIAIDQPHLSMVENYERRALFARAAMAIRHVLLDATTTAFSEGYPSSTWLCQFLRLLDVRRSTVITMNYDTIIETLTPEALCPWCYYLTHNHYISVPLCPADLFADLPPTSPSPQSTVVVLPRLYATPVELPRPAPKTLRLIKLHGSLDWFAARNDPTGATLVRWEADLGAAPPGREPFLVPPDANKSPYFDNPLVRELWLRSRVALEQAESVTLIGYSLPATDTTFAGMLADTIGSRNVPVTVVDCKPDPVIGRLRSLGIEATPMNDGPNPIQTWTEQLIEEQARRTAYHLRDLASHKRAAKRIWTACANVSVPVPPHANYPNDDSVRIVMPGRLVGDTFVLECQRPDRPTDSNHHRLTDFLPPQSAVRVIVDFGNTQRRVIAYEKYEHRGANPITQLRLLPMIVPHEHLA